MRKIVLLAISALALSAWGSSSFAGAITCPDAGARNITVDSAEDCEAVGGVTGTPKAGDVADVFPPGPYSDEGDLTGAGTSDWLTIEVTSGAFGTGGVAGNWFINPLFWTVYDTAVLSFHVGNGAGDPDWFFFLITPGEESGTFSYTNTGTGGGLSNVFLWGAGEPYRDVPEPATLGLLGLGLVGLGFGARRRRKI